MTLISSFLTDSKIGCILQKESMRKVEKGGGRESEKAVDEDMALAIYYCFFKQL